MTKLVPQVRFKGYDAAWESKKLGELATFSKGKGYTKNDIVKRGYPIILYGRLYTDYQTVISGVKDTFVNNAQDAIFSLFGDVIVPSSGESAEDIARASAVLSNALILGGDLNIIHPKFDILDSIFLSINISNGKQKLELSKRAQGKSVVHLNNQDLKAVNLNFPVVHEQQQIGSLFQKLDTAIELQ
ncbi:restriction endonuclease subunit S [Periweissella fabaria]|uniref:Type I restriction modification DNA specificity domain-containing protein n=1 Tax=Periweissella fabaria TaxID=546157 RepID=A0ABN8BJ46_9LACO|nr:restriction endonuclease subunit S [Periweissella fabaria]MCM0596392.1 restriction endonuclease subunit S [Periweissella fabaria]CAH0415880.1 hypothetical protein WFA24289_00178 [Periweissella fabaria]